MPPEGRPVKRKILIILSLLVIGAGAASWWYVNARASAVEFPTDVMSLLPRDATVIVYANMAALRDEPLVQHLAALAPGTQPGGEYAQFIAATGFEYQRDLDRVVLASTSAPSPQQPPAHLVVIADGRFDQKKIEAYALREGKMQQQNGHTVYTTPAATPGKTTAFTFLSAGRLAIADGDDMAGVLEPAAQNEPEAALQEQISRVAGSPVFVVAKVNPALTKGNPMASQFGSLRWVNLAARPDQERVLLSAEGTCDTPEQAKQLSTALEFMRSFARGMLADPKNLGNMPPAAAQAVSQMFETAQISTDMSRVRLLLSVDAEKLTALPATAPAPAAH
jgi:hypothetical protein